MKNDIEKLENLPQKESRKHLIANYDYRYRGHNGDCHKVNGAYPWTHVERILKSHIGKSFDKAFTAYCEIVPDYQQKWFLEEFDEDTRMYMSYRDRWYVDNNGNIKVKKGERPKKKISIESNDYKVEMVHKVTGHKMNEFEKKTTTKKITKYYHKWTTKYFYGLKWNKLRPKHERYVAKEEDFEPVVVSGWIKYYKSKNDREFKRLMAEKVKRHKKREPKKELSEVEYRAILKAQVLKEREATKRKLEAKGMRPDAFTNHRTDQ